MAEKIQLGDHMVPAILAHLAQFGGLPAEGILGGQSVCSAILDLFGSGGGVYNDLDVFRIASKEQVEHFRSEEHKQEMSIELGIPQMVLDEYGSMCQYAESGFQMLGSTREGLVNYVWCITTGNTDLTAALAVSVFDINAVEVAIDLSNKTMAWSRGFEHFLKTRQLELTSVNTPLRTLLRYLKKKDELQAYGDDALALQLTHFWLCQHADPDDLVTATDEPLEIDDLTPAPMLSTKYVQLAAKYLSNRSEYFALDSDGQVRLGEGNTSYSRLEELLGELSNFSEDDLDGFVRWLPLRAYADALEKAPGEQSRMDRYARYHERTVERLKLSWDEQLFWLPMSQAFLGVPFLRCQRSARHVRVITQFVAKHGHVVSALVGLTLQEQYDAVKWLKERLKADGQWVIGLVETQALPVDMRLPEHRTAFLARHESKRPKEVLNEPLFRSWTDGEWSIEELTRRTLLEHEGDIMGHCVGGYSQSVERGYLRIISVKHPRKENWSTLAVLARDLETAKEIRVQQHYGIRNKRVSDETAKALAAYLTQESARLALAYTDKGIFRGIPALDDLLF